MGFSASFKKEVLERIKKGETAAVVAKRYGCSPVSIQNWKRLGRKVIDTPPPQKQEWGPKEETIHRLTQEITRLKALVGELYVKTLG